MAHPQAMLMWGAMQTDLGPSGERVHGGAFRGQAPRRPHYSSAQVPDESVAREEGLELSERDRRVLSGMRRHARRVALAAAQTSNRKRGRSYRHQLERVAARARGHAGA